MGPRPRGKSWEEITQRLRSHHFIVCVLFVGVCELLQQKVNHDTVLLSFTYFNKQRQRIWLRCHECQT